MAATEVSQETTVLAAFSFFSGQKNFASLSEINCAYYLTSRAFLFEACYTQLSMSDTDTLELLVELISIYIGAFPFAEHGSYSSFHVRVFSKPIRRLINTLVGSDVLDGPSLFES